MTAEPPSWTDATNAKAKSDCAKTAKTFVTGLTMYPDADDIPPWLWELARWFGGCG